MHSIRSLHRGLKALEILNVKKALTVAEMAREIDIPRTTTYRILENLCAAGYLVRGKKDGRYCLTIRVRNLSSGFNDYSWLSETVRPLALELAKIVIWPISIMTPQYMHMSLRFTTDSESPLAIDYYKEGTSLPILSTASGHIYLAYCGDQEREIVLETLRRDKAELAQAFANNPTAISNLVDKVREQGFAVALRSQRTHEPGKTSTIAVPIMRDDRVLAVLAMRYIDRALSVEELKERYLPTLNEYAQKMEYNFHSSH